MLYDICMRYVQAVEYGHYLFFYTFTMKNELNRFLKLLNNEENVNCTFLAEFKYKPLGIKGFTKIVSSYSKYLKLCQH